MDSTLLISNFFLCFIRFMGMIMYMPLLSSPNIPVKIKPLIAYFVALAVFLNLPTNSFVQINHDHELLLFGFKEFCIGLIIGLNVAMVMEVLAFAGSIVSTPMGLAIATAIDPASGEQSTTMGQFNVTLATLIFLIINGHHIAFEAFMRSYDVISFGNLVFQPEKIEYFLKLFGELFEVSLRVSMPMLVALLLVQYSLGVIVRTLPKLNIFMVGIPIQILLGMVTYVITLPYMVKLIKILFDKSFRELEMVLKLFQ